MNNLISPERDGSARDSTETVKTDLAEANIVGEMLGRDSLSQVVDGLTDPILFGGDLMVDQQLQADFEQMGKRGEISSKLSRILDFEHDRLKKPFLGLNPRTKNVRTEFYRKLITQTKHKRLTGKLHCRDGPAAIGFYETEDRECKIGPVEFKIYALNGVYAIELGFYWSGSLEYIIGHNSKGQINCDDNAAILVFHEAPSPTEIGPIKHKFCVQADDFISRRDYNQAGDLIKKVRAKSEPRKQIPDNHGAIFGYNGIEVGDHLPLSECFCCQEDSFGLTRLENNPDLLASEEIEALVGLDNGVNPLVSEELVDNIEDIVPKRLRLKLDPNKLRKRMRQTMDVGVVYN